MKSIKKQCSLMKRLYKGVEDMAQWLGALAAFPGGLVLSLRIHMVVHNYP